MQEQRATVPMERDSIPVSAVEEQDPSTAPTLETTPAARPAPRPSPRGSLPKPAFQPAKGTAEIAPAAAVRAKLPPPPPAGGRMDRSALRFVFGTIALLLLGYYVVTWLRS